MNKIKSSQLFALLISIRVFSIICMTDLTDASQMAGTALSVGLQFLASVPMLLLYKDNSFSLKNEMLFSKFGKVLYILFFILWGSVSFSTLWDVSKSV